LALSRGQKLVLIEKGNSIELAKTGGIKPAMGIAKGVSAKFATLSISFFIACARCHCQVNINTRYRCYYNPWAKLANTKGLMRRSG